MNTIGTPFKSDDERVQRKVDRINKKPWEQEVRDEKGRKRFHGAFTGGFSAGYFNTVGTKEGWAPSNFVSSRNKADSLKKQQDVMDFMDEEDIQEQIGSHTITSKTEYKDYKDNINLTVNKTHSLFTNDTLMNELLPSFNSSIGNKLMTQSGYDENVQRKNQALMKTQSDKYYRGNLEFKDDYFGIGFTPEYDEAIHHASQNNETMNLINKNMIKMDKFEDDVAMGFFNSNDVTDFNFEEVEVDEIERDALGNKHPRGSSRKIDLGSAPKFNKSHHTLKSTKLIKFEMPKLPKDYEPFKRQKQEDIIYKSTYDASARNRNLNPDKRADLLKEKSDSVNTYFKSKFTTVDEINSYKDIKKDDYNNKLKPPCSTDQIANYFNFKIDIPFKNDLAKVSRFTKFIAEKEGLIFGDSFSSGDNLMTGSQLREERNLFNQLYEDEQKLKKIEESLQGEIKKNKDVDNHDKNQENTEKVNVVREKVKWKPEKLLCKRFKLKDPYENLIEVKPDKGLSDLQSSLLKEEFRKTQHSNDVNIPQTHQNLNPPLDKESSIKLSNNENNSFLIINAKPDMNLFEEIFG